MNLRRLQPGLHTSRQLTAFADRLITTGEVNAVVVGVMEGDRLAWGAAMAPDSASASLQEIGVTTRFDLASLTKPYAATAALILQQQGGLSLATPLGDLLPRLPNNSGAVSLSALFRHRAGLIPWYPFYSEAAIPPGSDRFTDPKLWQSPGGAGIYSDLGPILWSRLLHEQGVSPAAVLAAAGLRAAYQTDPTSTAPTRLSNRTECELAAALGIKVEEETVERRGLPQDGNARVIDESGHAGLFGDLLDVVALGDAWLHASELDRHLVDQSLEAEGRYALGWWRADPERDALRNTAFGHNGFTGCSLWVESEVKRVMVLLAHRTTLSDTLDRARRDFHRLALMIRP